MIRRAASASRSPCWPRMTNSRTARLAASCMEIPSARARSRSAACSSSVSRRVIAITTWYQDDTMARQARARFWAGRPATTSTGRSPWRTNRCGRNDSAQRISNCRCGGPVLALGPARQPREIIHGRQLDGASWPLLDPPRSTGPLPSTRATRLCVAELPSSTRPSSERSTMTADRQRRILRVCSRRAEQM